MKRQVIIIIGACLCAAVAIGAVVGVISMQPGETTTTTTQAPPSTPPTGGAMTKAQWEAMLDPSNFENFTVIGQTSMKYSFMNQNYSNEQETITKITNNKVRLGLVFEGKDQGYQTYEGIEAEEQRRACYESFSDLLANYDDFKYDNTTKTYVNVEPINVELTTTQSGHTVNIVAVIKDVVVNIGNDGKLLSVTYNGSYNIKASETEVIPATINENWTFSNYGTTVIE